MACCFQTSTQDEIERPDQMPRILEMKEMDGRLAVFLDMPPDEASPVHLWTDAERYAALKAEREACAVMLDEKAASLTDFFVKTTLPEYAIRAQDARDAAYEIRNSV